MSRLLWAAVGALGLAAVLAPVAAYRAGRDRGYDAGARAERAAWEDDGRNRPHIHETPDARFYVVRRLVEDAEVTK